MSHNSLAIFYAKRSFTLGVKDILNKTQSNKEIAPVMGVYSVLPKDMEDIYVSRSKTLNLLYDLTRENNVIKCIDMIVTKIPDGAMAYNTYMRFADTGFDVKFYNAQGQQTKRYDGYFREWASNIGRNNVAGLDGIVTQCYSTQILHGGIGVECVINKLSEGIQDVLVVDPASIIEFKFDKAKGRYAAYQQGESGNKVDLYDGNFFYAPYQPKPNSPIGTLMFEPAIQAITQQLTHFQDSLTILHRIGFPRYDISIDSEKASKQADNRSEQGVAEFLKKKTLETRSTIARAGKNTDLVHTDDITATVLGGGLAGSGIDIRAWSDVIDIQVMNAFQVYPTFMGRQMGGGSYALSQVEFKSMIDRVVSMQRNMKRILENIINFWCRVEGINVYAVVTMKTPDWQAEKDKLDVESARLDNSRKAFEYNFISLDEAATNASNTEGASAPDDWLRSFVKNVKRSPTGEEEKTSKEGTTTDEQQSQ